MLAYAGIGSRFIDQALHNEFVGIGLLLAIKGFTLRSGGAPGADSAFEFGCGCCDNPPGVKEIFLPWKKFNGNLSPLILEDPIPEKVREIASAIYPRWYTCNEPTRRLHARNVYQILGADLQSPSSFVVCFTDRDYNDPAAVGGTLFGIKLAEMHKIPVYNFYIRGTRERFYKEISNQSI